MLYVYKRSAWYSQHSFLSSITNNFQSLVRTTVVDWISIYKERTENSQGMQQLPPFELLEEQETKVFFYQ